MNSSDRIQTTVRYQDVSQSEAFLNNLFAKVEAAWEIERSPEFVDRLAGEYPEHAIALYDFMALLVSSDEEIDDDRSKRSRAKTKSWLEKEGFDVVRNIVAKERRKPNWTTSPTPPATAPQSNLVPLRTSGRKNPSNGHNKHFHEAVILGVLARRFATNAFPLGRLRRTKFAYLLHRHCEGITQGFLKKAAGPYNPTIRYGGGEKIALNKGYVVEYRKGFLVGPAIDEAQAYFDDWYGSECLVWLDDFRYYKNEELELLTTIDMAIVELRSRQSTVNVATVKEVLATNSEWAKKLSRPIFCDTNIAKEIKKSEALFGR